VSRKFGISQHDTSPTGTAESPNVMLWRNASTEHVGEADSVADRSYRTLSRYDSPSRLQSPIRNRKLVITKKHKSGPVYFGVRRSHGCV
jgi:hypothetical protein